MATPSGRRVGRRLSPMAEGLGRPYSRGDYDWTVSATSLTTPPSRTGASSSVTTPRRAPLSSTMGSRRIPASLVTRMASKMLIDGSALNPSPWRNSSFAAQCWASPSCRGNLAIGDDTDRSLVLDDYRADVVLGHLTDDGTHGGILLGRHDVFGDDFVDPSRFEQRLLCPVALREAVRVPPVVDRQYAAALGVAGKPGLLA